MSSFLLHRLVYLNQQEQVLIYQHPTYLLYFSNCLNYLEYFSVYQYLIYLVYLSNFANNTILSCFFFFFLIIDLYFLIPAVITQILNPVAELVMPIGILTKEAKAEIETLPVIVEITISG